MIFNRWQEHLDAKLSISLLWEYDMNNFDWHDMRTIVVQRVIERGWLEDFYAAIRIYGGIENFRKIITEIPILTDKEMTFVCVLFNIKKYELRCYTRKQLREKLLNS